MADVVVTGIEVTAAALAIPTGLSVVFFKPVRRAVRNLLQFLDDWSGEPGRPGVPARPGVLERLGASESEARAARTESAETRRAVSAALIESEKRSAAVLADIDVRLGGVEMQVAEIHHETQPNGGWSIKDQINRLDPLAPAAPPPSTPAPKPRRRT